MDDIRVTSLTQHYGTLAALDNISISFAHNQITGLLGRNGAGKSTLLDILTGRRHATSGTVDVLGEDPYENRRILSQVCGISESQRYPTGFTVAGVLDSASWLHPNWDGGLAQELVGTFALRRRQKVARLSRGQRSALGVVIGLASCAPVTVFDEPYVGLDAVARRTFYDLLLEQFTEQPRTLILSSHLIDEIAHLLERVVVLDQGRVVLDAPTDQVRGSVVVVTGPSVTVDAFTDGLDVLHQTHLAGLTRATVRGADVEVAHTIGLRVDPLSLQEIVIALSGADVIIPSPHPVEVVAS